MMPNPTGFDGLPMENHHIARQDQNGERNLIARTVHRLIHEQETDAVRDVFQADGLKGFNPSTWTAKESER